MMSLSKLIGNRVGSYMHEMKIRGEILPLKMAAGHEFDAQDTLVA